MPQHFCFVGCDFVTERSDTTQHNATEKQKISAIKLRIRRTANFTYQQFQTEITNLFSNWKNTLIENPQLSKPNASKLKLHKYRFGLNHNELRADLDAMLTEHRRGINQSENPPSLPRMTRMMKRKQRAAAHSHNQSSGHVAKGVESDSSVDESLLYQIHANMHGLAPLGFLNDPLCTINSKKRRRSRKLISYREEMSVSPSSQQKVTVLGPTSVKIDDQVVCTGNRVKIHLLKENRSRRGTVIEIHKNQVGGVFFVLFMLVETAKQQRWKVNFSDLKNGRINVHPSQIQK
ncbi:hypothetical protein RFI_09080 [Reticulomyxa filosa]|uniref:Uncharacterized protein n=1 Tax=Reticulomyxa filosa TaxID=46433 RepID=X6NRT6_RETFI|nr:hypothetical protein RFI_09080 [Reticulomyxa filosa]|eukprot:ETO28052.1 hypothetical protein RFI_09080 [Reticulomyxa filosa]